MSVVINILLLILVIGCLTLVHELGHFVAAKLVGAKVFEFSIGFGPKIFGKEFRGTMYCIRVLPFGGYVQILGDGDPSDDPKHKDDEHDLSKKPIIQQIFVMLAGVTMNVILAICIYYVVLGCSGWSLSLDNSFENFKPIGAKMYREVDSEVTYLSLVDGGNAMTAGFPDSGTIKSINGADLVYSDEVKSILSENKGRDVTVNICVNDECSDYVVPVSDEGMIGIMMQGNYHLVLSYEDDKVFAGFSHIYNNLRLIGIKLGDLFNDAQETGDYTELSNSVSGPVGIYLVIDYVRDFGVIPFLSIVADLSLSLAIVNVLPIPALDGGRVLLLAIEGIIRRKINEDVKAWIINISFIFLIILIILVMVKDIVNIDALRNLLS